MMRALGVSVAWILTGALIGSGLFWAFLNTPESTVFMLGVSLLLVLLLYATGAIVTSGAIAGWASGWRGRRVANTALAGIPAALPPVLLALAAWWLIGRGLGWWAAHSGEISAWFIATVNWSDVTPLLNGVRLAGEWLRLVVVPFAALVWLAELLSRGWRPLVNRAAMAHALSPLRLVLVTLLFVTTLWAPITYGAYWMPRGLPPTWVEPAVAIGKFAAMALVGAAGLSLIVRLASREAPPSA